jgi:hypothetical protein
LFYPNRQDSIDAYFIAIYKAKTKPVNQFLDVTWLTAPLMPGYSICGSNKLFEGSKSL